MPSIDWRDIAQRELEKNLQNQIQNLSNTQAESIPIEGRTLSRTIEPPVPELPPVPYDPFAGQTIGPRSDDLRPIEPLLQQRRREKIRQLTDPTFIFRNPLESIRRVDLADEAVLGNIKNLLLGEPTTFGADISRAAAGEEPFAQTEEVTKAFLGPSNLAFAGIGKTVDLLGNPQTARTIERTFGDAVTLGRKGLRGAKTLADDVTQSSLARLQNQMGQVPADPRKATDEVVESVDDVAEAFTPEQTRGFIETIKRADKNPELASKVSGQYNPLTNEDTLTQARQLVDDDFVEAMRIAKSSENTADSNAISLVLIEKLNAEGKIDDAVDIANILAEKGTKSGQASQILAAYNRLTPTGVLRFATKKLDDARSALPKGTLNKFEKTAEEVTTKLNQVNKEVVDQVADEVAKAVETADDFVPQATKAVSKTGKQITKQTGKKTPKGTTAAVDEAAQLTDEAVQATEEATTQTAKTATPTIEDAPEVLKEAVDEGLKQGRKSKGKVPKFGPSAKQISKAKPKTPAEKLAQRIATATEGPKEKVVDPLQDMVNTLHKVAKETLPKKGVKVPENSLKLIRDALTKRKEYQKVWQDAQEIVRNKFAKDAKALEELDKFFGRSPSAPFANTQLTNAVRKAIKENNVDLRSVVKKHFSEQNLVKTKLSEKLSKQAGISLDDAEEIENFVKFKFDELAKVKKEQVLKQIFRESPKIQPTAIDQKIIELSNLGAFSKREYRQLVAKKLGLPAMDDELASELAKRAELIQSLPAGRAKDVATAEMLKLVADQVPTGGLTKISSIQTMAQLLNPKTFIRNVIGNAGFQPVEAASDVLSVPIDKVVSKFTGQRTKVLPRFKPAYKGFTKGLREGLEDANKGIDTLRTVKTQFDLPKSGVFKGKVGKAAEKLLNIELRATDRAFYQSTFDNSLDMQMRAAKVAKPTEEMLEIAHHDALYRTFQDENATTKVFSGLKKALNAGQDFGLGDFILKYPKTPANLLNRGVAYSPAGFVNSLYQIARPLMGKAFQQKQFVESISRAFIGTAGLVGTGALLHRLGIITGKPSDDYEIQGIERSAGLGEYRINVSALKRFVLSGMDADTAKLEKGDTLVSYDWFQPVAISISIGANLDDTKGVDGVGLAATVATSIKNGVDTLTEQPLISGITRFFRSGDVAEGLATVAESAPSSFVPSVLSQIRILTDQPRQTYDPDIFKRAKNRAFARTPFLSSKLPPRLDQFGNEQKFHEEGSTFSQKAFNSFLNPDWVSNYKPTPEAELVLDLYRQTGETKQAPRFVNKKQRLKGLEVELTTQELQEMQKFVGNMAQERFRALAEDKSFLSKTPEQQVDILSKELTEIGKIAKLTVLGDKFAEKAPDKLTQELLKQDMEKLEFHAKAEQVFERLKGMDKKEANKIAGSLKKKDKRLFDKLKDIAEDNKKNLTLEDRKIKQLNVANGFRARYIWEEVSKLNTSEEKNAYLKELKEKGILSRKVLKQLKNIKKGKPFDAKD